MKKQDIKTRILDELLKNYVWIIITINIIIVIILIYNNKLEISEFIERMIKMMVWWISIYIVIFVPRKILRRSRNFRKWMIYIRKKNAKIFYYRYAVTNFWEWYYFIFDEYIMYYLKRILDITLVGTKYEGVWPYKKNWERGEVIKEMIMEIYRFVFVYMPIYIMKKYYEIFNHYDRLTIRKLIRSRLIGYMFIMGLFYGLGVNWMIYMTVIIVIVIIIKQIWMMKDVYKNLKERYKEREDRIKNAIILGGFTLKISTLVMLLKEYRHKSFIFMQVFYYKDIFGTIIRQNPKFNHLVGPRGSIEIDREGYNVTGRGYNEYVEMVKMYEWLTKFDKIKWYYENEMNSLFLQTYRNSLWWLSNLEDKTIKGMKEFLIMMMIYECRKSKEENGYMYLINQIRLN